MFLTEQNVEYSFENFETGVHGPQFEENKTKLI